MKRVFAMFLTLAMLLGLMPTALAAEAEDGHSSRVVQATEIPSSRLDELDLSGGRQPAAQPLYQDDDMVTVIVQLEGPSLLDYYNLDGAALLSADSPSDEELTAGEAVSAFLSHPGAQELAEELLDQQQSVLSAIGGLSGARARSAQPEVAAQWTALLNGMAVRVPYGQLSAIRALDGVKRAYVQHTYAVPEPPEFEGAGTAGYSYDMVGLADAWNAGYTGKGMVVAVVDTGLDLDWASFSTDDNDSVTAIRHTHEAFREDSFKSDDPDEFVRFKADEMSDFLADANLKLHAKDLDRGDAVETAAYKNRKIPYAVDYSGSEITVGEYAGQLECDVDVYPGRDGSNHGTHVAGTVAGYAETINAETNDAEVIFSGVAPDAQLLIMKVFADEGGGATDVAVINALEDAAALGADVVNLSLGSDNGFADDDTVQNEVYANMKDAGLILMTSAGNSASSSADNQYGGSNLTSDPDTAMMSSPAIYPSNLAVASINSSVDSQMTLVWKWNDGTNSHEIGFTDPYTVAMKSDFSADKMLSKYPNGLKLIDVGYGTKEEYEAAFKQPDGTLITGIALAKRGSTDPEHNPISFTDKVKNSEGEGLYYIDSDKVRQGAVAVIIYDNDPNGTKLINMSVDGVVTSSAFISGQDGEAIVAAIKEGRQPRLIQVNQENVITSYDKAGEMSEFTSWGAGPALELKPEITAPGGNIWSSVFDLTYDYTKSGYHDDYTGSYAMMSGTSMAAPHMSGLAALVRQYVKEEGLASDGSAAAALTQRLLVSTALPQKQKETGADANAYYSPRQQGAGLVNIGAAINTPAYITVEGNKLVGKLELLDDPNWTGSYDLKFTVNNLTDRDLTYNAKAVLQRPDTKTDKGNTLMLDRDVLIDTVDLGTVTVPARSGAEGGSVEVSKTINLSDSLTAAELEELKELFPNGTYIEGFIILTDPAEEDPQIGLPFLAFLGDWTAAPIFDRAMWFDEKADNPDWNPWDDGDYTWFPSIIGSAIIGSDGNVLNWLNLGQNVFDDTSGDTQKIHHKENFTISPNGDGFFDTIDDIELYQLRDAKMIVVQVRDAKTGELYFNDFSNYNTRTLYRSDYGAAIPSSLYYFTTKNWDGTKTNADGSKVKLPSGTKCIYTITAYGEGDYGSKTKPEGVNVDYPVTNFWAVDPTKPETEPTFNGHPMDKTTGDVISFPVTVDYEAPKLTNNTVSIRTENGKLRISGEVYDEDGSLACVEIVPIVRMIPNEAGINAGIKQEEVYADLNNPFDSKIVWNAGLDKLSFDVDVSSYEHVNVSAKDEFYDFKWTGNVRIDCGDYGANERSYFVIVQGMDTQDELLLSQTSALLHPGSEFELSVIDNVGGSEAITRTSSNPEVATVNKFGMIKAIAPGQTTITVSKGGKSATCVVAVENYPTEVVDFKLSIDRFSGLKPDGAIVVNVVDLYPADVKLNQVHWKVYEDDATADDYEGLVTVGRYTDDMLSGEIYLKNSANTEFKIPGGSGYLEVTLNGVTRCMDFDWEDLYTSANADGLKSDADFLGEQTVEVTCGETAFLMARYRQSHDVIPVELHTAAGLSDSSYPTGPSVGLELDGQPVGPKGGTWTGKLVNKENYALPKKIYVYGYEHGIHTRFSYQYTYDSATGDLEVNYLPSGSNGKLLIFADGVESPGAPKGTPSGEQHDALDGLYGPFNWSMTQGMTSVAGKLEAMAGEDHYGNPIYYAEFTPSKPGVSYITATSRDGKYSINFAVICEGVKAASLDLKEHDLNKNVGDTITLAPIFSPTPTLDKDKELVLKSFNEKVVKLNDDGTLTAVGEGTAYIKAAVKTNTKVTSYCVVNVADNGTRAITYKLDGGAISSGAPKGYTISDEEQTLTIPAPTKSGCSFTGWTYAGQTTPASTVTLPANYAEALTLTANWRAVSTPPSGGGSGSSGGNSGGNGSGGGPTTTTQPSTNVTTGDKTDDDATVTQTTAVPSSTVTEGAATSTISNSMGEEIVKQAVDNESERVVIAPEITGSVTSAEVSIPAATIAQIGERTDADLQVDTPVASVVIPNEALSDLAASGGQVAVSAQRTDDNTVEITVTAKGEEVASVTGGLAVTVPQEDAGPGTVAMLIFEDGTTQVIRQSMVSGDGESIQIPLDGSAKLVIKDNSQTFTDVRDTDWSADAIAFASSHELMNGTGGGAFDPGVPMTRAMLATVLHNLENNKTSDVSTAFTDVKDGAWYVDAIQWAAEKGIVVGYSDGTFGPNNCITREQLAVMLYRYAGSPEVSAAELDFTDAGDISSYARDAMSWAVANGILRGFGNGTLSPKGDATRAQTAQMLLNFMTSIIAK